MLVVFALVPSVSHSPRTVVAKSPPRSLRLASPLLATPPSLSSQASHLPLLSRTLPSRRGVLCRTHPSLGAHTSPFSSSSRLHLPLALALALSFLCSQHPLAMTRLSLLKTRLVRLIKREGAIRLEEKEPVEEKKGLPWFLSAEEASREGYTNVHLLGECIAASNWNALCLFYLLHPSFLSSRSPYLPEPTHDGYLYALTFLTLVPLAIGVMAGSAALWSDEEGDVESRKAWGGAKRGVVWVGTVGCIASMWPLLRLAVAGWDVSYRAEMAVILIVLQAFLVKSGSDSSFPSNSPDSLASSAEYALLVPSTDDFNEKYSMKDMREADEETVKIVVQFSA
ncbi:hypothetical protein RTBOTA2_004235 [Rhodotorula toruloides]|nr:hypothetical protein RTBOTA2_004235 [Rhodotorula toruloides]